MCIYRYRFKFSKTFDKIILLMLENCEKSISQGQINELLTPENILTTDEKYLSLLNFSSEIFMDPFYEIIFSDEERDILKDINNFSDDSELSLDIDIDKEIFTKNEKIKYVAIGAGSMFIFLMIINFVKSLLNSPRTQNKTDGRKKRN